MSDLENLKPEVSNAVRTMRGAHGNRDDAYDVIEAELIGLAAECAQLRDLLADREMDREMRKHANAELAAIKAKIGAPPTDAETLNRACDAYTDSAIEHGWNQDEIEYFLRCDDMRAAIAAVWPRLDAGDYADSMEARAARKVGDGRG